jgi:hypothetical protein
MKIPKKVDGLKVYVTLPDENYNPLRQVISIGWKGNCEGNQFFSILEVPADDYVDFIVQLEKINQSLKDQLQKLT